MLDVGQAVLVITDKGVSYPGYVLARAQGYSGGPPAYQVSPQGGGQQSQWHKASEVWVLEETGTEDPNWIESFMKKKTLRRFGMKLLPRSIPGLKRLASILSLEATDWYT